MKTPFALVLVLCCSCLDFGARLEQCRDGGVWTCGDAGTLPVPDAGAPEPDAGNPGPDAGTQTFEGPTGLICNDGWCWDHPRPTGVTLNAIWGTSANDLWAAGEAGTLMHFDGRTWLAHPQDPRANFTSLCGRGAEVFAGAAGDTVGKLLRWDGGSWASVGLPENVRQLQCTASGVWIAREGGASFLPSSGGSLQTQFSLAPGSAERCVGIAEVNPGGCVVSCQGDGSGLGFARMRRCDGGVEYEVVDRDGGRGTSFAAGPLWTDPVSGVMAGIAGARAEVWQRDRNWATVWDSQGQPRDVYAGAAFDGGSIAVGAYGLVLDVRDGGVQQQPQLITAGNGYLLGVWAPPAGDAWVVGERGCIVERVRGAWQPRSACAVGFEDLTVMPGLFAVTTDALYGRTDAGWALVSSLDPEQVAFRPVPDGGGFVHLSKTKLTVNQNTLPITFTRATNLEVVAPDRVVVIEDSATLVDVTLAGARVASFDAGLALTSLTADTSGVVWAAGASGTVLRSDVPGAWTRESAGLTADVSEVAVGFGRVWALSGSSLAIRSADGGWTRETLTEGAFSRVVPIDAQTAVLLRHLPLGALRVSSTFVTSALAAPPNSITGRIVLRGDELWGVGVWGGVVRFRVR